MVTWACNRFATYICEPIIQLKINCLQAMGELICLLAWNYSALKLELEVDWAWNQIKRRKKELNEEEKVEAGARGAEQLCR